jgi:hypothetical protein
VAAALVPAASAGAPGPWKTITLEKRHGSLNAVLTVQRWKTRYGAFEFRRMKLVVRNGGHTVFNRLLCSEDRCSIASQHWLDLKNVWGDAAPEVVLDTYTGGAHCCFESLIVLTGGGHAGHAISHFWGDPGYSVKTLGGAPVFVTADDRFAYAFTSFAASGLPVEVFAIGAHGVMNDVTQSQLTLVKKDAAQWWHAYTSLRGKSAEDDIRGVLGAWCADEYRLDDKAACDTELASALKKGYLKGPGIWPQNAKYIAFLHRELAKWGYRSP